MQTWHIHIEGQVQGVGFRPCVYKLAKRFKLAGWVSNTMDGVHIEFNASAKTAAIFYDFLIQNAPKLAHITNHQLFNIQQRLYDNFQIVQSKANSIANLMLPPDFALCADCREELEGNEISRRKNYPFISCTNCGPRFSIIQQLPYDRINTTLEDLPMCKTCKKEYHNPLDRRYFSQTNTCPYCSINLTLIDAKQKVISGNSAEIINKIIEFWYAGKIVAIKGLGGYLLTGDATNESTIQKIRQRKHRPSKPLALMFPNLNTIAKSFDLQEQEVTAITSPAAPIILLPLKSQKEEHQPNLSPSIAPKLTRIGVMLPYTPLLYLLLKKFGKAIISTSANISNAPIVFKDKKAVATLGSLADFIVSNNLEIVTPQDDSVVKFTIFKQQKIILRRSRGIAPSYFYHQLELPTASLLATGAMLKSSFSLLHQNTPYISQYLGDLANFDTLESYKSALQHFLNLFEIKPEIILSDKHPRYPSTLYAETFSTNLGIAHQQIQHHYAHFSAILGEHHLIDGKTPILGVIWDGTGLGDDQQIWGGEFFIYQSFHFTRLAHFDYFAAILGDKMTKEPRISALSTCWGILGMEKLLKDKFTQTEWTIYNQILSKDVPLKTSSVGRIFDAVACLLGIQDKQSYEGEAAMQLEVMATEYFKVHGLNFHSNYFSNLVIKPVTATKMLMTNILEDLQKGKGKAFIAAKFHYSMVILIKKIATQLKIKQLAFSGGVFQNGLLVDLIQHHLSSSFKLYFHQQLAPNDENISFGQLIYYHINESRKKKKKE